VAVVTVLAERLMKLLKKQDRKIEERIVREVFDGAMSGRLIKWRSLDASSIFAWCEFLEQVFDRNGLTIHVVKKLWRKE
jgi:hypothetical protein